MLRPRWSATAFILLIAGGCRGEADPIEQVRICTEMGCAGGLNIRFSHQPQAPFRLEAELLGDGVFTIHCEDLANRCQRGVYLESFIPDIVELRFIAAADTFTQVVRPTYQNIRPNGPACPPEYCIRGEVTVDLPEAW